MASKANMLVVLAILAAIAAPAALAKDFVVGDDSGWKLDFDYKNWAAGKQFLVGDSIAFNYPQGAHNVIKVNKTEYDECIIPVQTVDPLSSGNDVISLKEGGKKWYICGVSNHCSQGMKLAIDVWSQWDMPVYAPAPSPIGNSAPNSNVLFSMIIGAPLTIFFIILA